MAKYTAAPSFNQFLAQHGLAAATWRQHPYTRKGHLFLGAHPHRALCGTLAFATGYHPGAAATYCARCVRAAQRLPSRRAAHAGM